MAENADEEEKPHPTSESMAEGKGKETLTLGRREKPRHQLASTRPLRKQLREAEHVAFRGAGRMRPSLHWGTVLGPQ